MAGEPLFVDSGGFYALLVRNSPAHERAVECLNKAKETRRRLVTTDYVLDETATLLRARGLSHLLDRLFAHIQTSTALEVVWITPERFAASRDLMLQYRGQEFSFTDCTSFIVMRERGLIEALATDHHFLIAGFIPVLA
jgi:predicted nucleic acid-binding protein